MSQAFLTAGMLDEMYRYATIPYTSHVGFMPIHHATSGMTEGHLFYVYYSKDGVSDKSKRPVWFLFDNLGNGIIPIPGDVAVNTIINGQFKRGYIQSWNFTVQKQLRYGWTAEAGYVATRSTGQLAFFDRNAGQVGGGLASQPLNIQYGFKENSNDYSASFRHRLRFDRTL